jgi:hypothetical protein
MSGENYIMKSLMIYPSPNVVRVIKSASSVYGEEERCIQGFGGETRGKATTWETQA